jgi:two-component system chemotaxis response regulator CheB
MSRANDLYCVGIGASAGGVSALKEFFDRVPVNTGAAYFVITHLPKHFKSSLTGIIELHTSMPVVRVVSDVAEVCPNTVYVLSENTMMTLDQDGIRIRQREVTETINRSINIFFSSLASACRNKAIGIILSGSGQDGAEGALEIDKQGGIVLVQSPDSTNFESMPHAAIDKDHPLAISRPSGLARMLSILLKAASPNI